MYIVELILGALKKKKKNLPPPELEEFTRCEHVFMPVDSTGEMLACANCGLLKHRDMFS
ncbi:MAG: hypothetical protein LBJ74_05225 [Heliobacteriaceae bacterium]|jgi:hypothetical protein|nr:hypothetical protein [Heliobacteriaceae bacterium]